MQHTVAKAAVPARGDPSFPNKELLRFLICGAAGGGKSTLVERLLSECKRLSADEIAALAFERSRFRTAGVEQEATPAVAYQYFATARRKLMAADTPGHAQHTRAVASAASAADIAVLLTDAREGLLAQIRRHTHIVALLGIRDIILLVNKMDAVAWGQEAFERIRGEYYAFAAQLRVTNITCIPACALHGDNVTRKSRAMPWYVGPTLLEQLESVDISSRAASRPFRMPVQRVEQPSAQFPGYCGTIVAGNVRRGDQLAILPGERTAQVSRIVICEGDLDQARAGQAVTLTFANEVAAERGDVLAAPDARPAVAEQFSAHIIWIGEQPMLPGRSYLLQTGTALVPAQVTELKHKLNLDTFEHLAAKHLDLDEIAFCNLALDRAIVFDPYPQSRDMGAFILIDRMTNATVARGMIDFPLRRDANIHWQALKLDKAARATLKRQKPAVLWLTGLSGAGKSTIADLVEQSLHRAGHHTIVLDGDNIRHGLNRDLGFTDEDRVENIRRIAEVAKLMVEAGLIVIVSFISPFRGERHMARGLVGAEEFVEIYVDTPLEICEARDPKGLYKLARAGKLPNLTGIGSAYEPPEHPDLVLAAGTKRPDVLAQEVLATLKRRGVI